MDDEILNDPRVRQILSEADRLRALLQRSTDRDEVGRIQRVLAGIYEDLGRTVHSLLPATQDFDDTDEAPKTDVMNLQELAERLARARGGDADDRPTYPGFEPDDEITSVRVFPKGEDLAEFADVMGFQRVRALLASGALDMAEDGEDPFPADRKKGDKAPPLWVEPLGDLLELIALPADLDHPVEMAAEASRIQWCTMDIEKAWGGFPVAIRLALLGLCAARARYMQDRLESPAGPKLVLERLRAYQEGSGLKKVVGLNANRGSELPSWSEDARQWWEALLTGLGNV